MCGKYKRETLERKRGCVSELNNICKLLVYEIKQCVLSPPKYFKSTTNGLSHQQLVSKSLLKNIGVFEIHLNFLSCETHILIIPQCRVHH